jgi:hypothetical protein
MKTLLVTGLLMMTTFVESLAQCAMCRATLENNLSNGNVAMAASINIGILYLFLAPYTAVGLIAYFWYRTSKNNARQDPSQRSASM